MRDPCEWAVGDHEGGAVGKMGEKAEGVRNGAGGERCAWGMRLDQVLGTTDSAARAKLRSPDATSFYL